MHCKKSQFLSNFLQIVYTLDKMDLSIFLTMVIFKKRNICMLALKRSTYASLVGFFLLFQFFCFNLDLESDILKFDQGRE
jgi:hypothetical protein